MILLPGQYLYSQKDINTLITLDQYFDISEITNPKINYLVSYLKGDFFYFIHYNSRYDKDKFCLNKINLKTGKRDCIQGVFNYQHLTSGMFSNYDIVFKSILIKDNRLYISHFRKIYIYEILPDELLFINSKEVESENINCIEESIYLYHNYNFNKRDDPNPTIILKYDKSFYRVSKSIYPVFDNLCYTHYSPGYWISFSNSEISFSQTTEYKVQFFNSELEQCNSLERTIKKWKKPQCPDKRIYASDCFEYCNPQESSTARLLGGQFINDTTFITQYKLPNSSRNNFTYFFDIWVLRGNKWILDKDGLCNSFEFFPTETEILTKENFPFNSLTYSKYITGENMILSFRIEPKIDPIGMTYGDYLSHKNSSYLDSHSSKILRIFVYKIKI